MEKYATEKCIDSAVSKLNNFNTRNVSSNNEIDRVCKASFGFSRLTIMVIWNKLVALHVDLDSNLHVIHLLWMLMYFK